MIKTVRAVMFRREQVENVTNYCLC
jgi:hypothetical protein